MFNSWVRSCGLQASPAAALPGRRASSRLFNRSKYAGCARIFSPCEDDSTPADWGLFENCRNAQQRAFSRHTWSFFLDAHPARQGRQRRRGRIMPQTEFDFPPDEPLGARRGGAAEQKDERGHVLSALNKLLRAGGYAGYCTGRNGSNSPQSHFFPLA